MSGAEVAATTGGSNNASEFVSPPQRQESRRCLFVLGASLTICPDLGSQTFPVFILISSPSLESPY